MRIRCALAAQTERNVGAQHRVVPAVNVTISAEARQRLGEIAARERRRPYSQAGLMLERLLLDPELAQRLSNPEPISAPVKPGRP